MLLLKEKFKDHVFMIFRMSLAVIKTIYLLNVVNEICPRIFRVSFVNGPLFNGTWMQERVGRT